MDRILPNLNAEKLQSLYWNDKLSILQIATMYGCAQRTIHNRMLEYDIPRRSLEKPLPKDELEKLYIGKKMSTRKIALVYQCAYSHVDKYIRKYKFPIRSLAEAHITTFRAPFSGDLSERAYLLGFRIGDLRVRKVYKNSETILVDCGSTRMDIIEHVKNMFEPYGRIWIGKPTKLNKIQVECSLDESFSYLLPKYQAFPKWTTQNQKTLLSILAGFIDAEGCFSIFGNGQAFFSLGNYNKDILLQIATLLDKLKIHFRFFLSSRVGYVSREGYVRNGDYWILQINRKYDLYCFVKKIYPYLRYVRKINDANRVLSNIEERNLRWGYINWPNGTT